MSTVIEECIHYFRDENAHNVETEILSKAKQRILSQAGDQDYKSLEDYLNALYYPKKQVNPDADLNDMIQRVHNQTLEYIQEVLKKDISNYDFSQGLYYGEARIDKEVALIGEKFVGTKEHEKQIRYTTLQTRYNQLVKYYDTINKRIINNELNMGQLKIEFQKLWEQLPDLILKCQQAISDAISGMSESDFQRKYFTKSKNLDSWDQLITSLDTAYNLLRTYDSLSIDPGAIGAVFEHSLNVFSGLTAQSAKNISDNLLKEMFKKETAGAVQVNRGGLFNIEGFEAKIEEVTETKEGKERKNIQYKVSDNHGNTVTLEGAFAEKEGKMDVLFDFPYDSSDPKTFQRFRVSAKNWEKIEESSLGETSIGAAILRTVGLRPTLGYGFALAYTAYADKGLYPWISQYAKACVLVDVLMGYSQKTGYADTLIVNERSKSGIKVYSIAKILEENKYLNAVLSGGKDPVQLDERALGHSMIGESKIDFSRKVSGSYLNTILTELQAQKIKLSSSILNE